MSEILVFLLPGAMYFWILFIGQTPMLEVVQEQESWIAPRILACPVTAWQYVLSKMLRCFILCSLVTVLLLVASKLLFGIKWGNPLALAAVVAAWACSMTGLLGVIYALARTREQANIFSPVVLMICAMLGGGMFPFERLPTVLQTVGQFTPNRWAVVAMQSVVHAKPVSELARPLAALAMLGVVGSVVALFLLKRRLAGGGRG